VRAKLPAIKAWRSVLISAAKAQAREAIRIQKRRRGIAARKAADRRAQQSDMFGGRKPSTSELLTDAEARWIKYLTDPTQTRALAFREIARAEGISTRAVRRIAGRLATMQIQELATRGEVTIQRIGRLRLVTRKPRQRMVNVRGKVGQGGEMRLVESPPSVAVSFQLAASLAQAIRGEGTRFDKVNQT
jgi:hypothetical protein